MILLEELSIQNFKCFRESKIFNLSNSNYFIGVNNSGKSAVLKAIQCFFDDSAYEEDFVNKTEFRAKGAGYNKSVLSITFNFAVIEQTGLKRNLTNQYGQKLKLFKNFTYREKSGTLFIDYTINGQDYLYEDLHGDLQKLLSRISVSYIHPQEANELLANAQKKLKKRLLTNWGTTAQLSEILKDLQSNWDDLRSKANQYLSSGLTNSLQDIWPGCSTIVDLPEKVEDLIGISEILFQSSKDHPQVSLTSQGTGAQSTILYQTHYLLDSDKSLHRGFYHPIWLIEEPESFLHADIIFKLGYLLSSKTWINNIQMLVSTHSPLLLATTKSNEDSILWYHLDNHEIIKEGKVSDFNEEEIKEIGVLMGDPNFEIYFKTSGENDLIILEDKKEITKEKLVESGVNVTHQLNGSNEQRRYFDVLRGIEINVNKNVFFLVDNDKGFNDFRNVINNGELIATSDSGFKKYEFSNNVFLIVFPESYAMEELFEEHDAILESCANQIFNSEFTHAASGDVNIPANLTRAHASIRNKTATGLDEAKKLIRTQQDVKDVFWTKVEEENLKIDPKYSDEINLLINGQEND